ncbi:hypothetical protein KGQ19_03695 [Catenulispora sp. NL8]|uniref:Uncharacterized protein n=1 Tax=Catenulispora pinistramenti TaxID=2705254 RepID=A0ABS5KHX5_9ACTN|nr:hypothetical protein [Catenulispora pinistramenti]MBS2545964.1 hypothetical protein [Catenulispora pinistramenti]
MSLAIGGVVAATGGAGAATSTAATPAPPPSHGPVIALTAGDAAACKASVEKQLVTKVSATDVAVAVKSACDLQIKAVGGSSKQIAAGATPVQRAGTVSPAYGGDCPCTYWTWSNGFQVYSPAGAWSATMHASWSGDNLGNFIQHNWTTDLRCTQDYAYGYTISMGSCNWSGPDPTGAGGEFFSHMDFVVSWLFKGFPVSVTHGANATYQATGHGDNWYSSY